MKNCKGDSIVFALKQLKTMTGKLTTRFFANFDTEIVCEAVLTFLADNNSLLLADPPDQQH